MLTIPQALRNAIASEEAAGAFYRALVPRALDVNAATLLETMARDEDAHAAQLQALAGELVGGELPVAPDALVPLVENAPHLCADARVSFSRALFLALDAEHHAAQFYAVVAEATEGGVRELLLTLAATEDRHAANIERLLDELTGRS